MDFLQTLNKQPKIDNESEWAFERMEWNTKVEWLQNLSRQDGMIFIYVSAKTR